ncbi:MAG: hypothetical protein OCD02_10375 [Spirochaetaceae bacterium]
MNKVRIYLIFIILICNFFIFSEEKQILEFNNKPITDVLMVLADLSEKNIIVDNTVGGNCSYYFTTTDLDEALKLFLTSQNLYMFEIDGALLVSKIFSINDGELISLNCTDVDIKQVLDRLTADTGITILYDNLPRTNINLNIKKLTLKVVLEIIIKKFTDYNIEEAKDYFYIKKNVSSNKKDVINKTNGIIVNNLGFYSVNLKKVRFSAVIGEFFSKEDIEYSIQGRNDNIIDRLEYKDKTFDEMLNLLLESGSCDYVKSNDIYYIFDINKNEIANRHIETQIIKLNSINVKELLKLMPGSFMSNNVLKVDEVTNSVIVYGTEIKIAPIVSFIKLVDKDRHKKPYWIQMSFVSAELFKNMLLKSYSGTSIVNVDKNSFLIVLTAKEYNEVLELKEIIDIPVKRFKVTLKYITTQELLDNLPKSAMAEQIVKTPISSVFFYYGQKEAYKAFMVDLNFIDKPKPQIKYKILVLQNTIGDGVSYDFGMTSHSEENGDITLPEDEWSSFSGSLGSLLGLNFNLISALGPLFSFELNASINNNRSKILVDTTLQGLSGSKVSFRNTTTSRFYQSSTNSDGETEQTGATQEVSWGIILDIEGWTSGDGMVTVKVQSTLSDETTVSGDSSGIPSTSEKIVNTEVRTPEGIPVVIGGLISSKIEVSEDKTPILGDIPLLGRLFRKTVKRETESEFVIYLLPYVEDSEEVNLEAKFERAYTEFIN